MFSSLKIRKPSFLPSSPFNRETSIRDMLDDMRARVDEERRSKPQRLWARHQLKKLPKWLDEEDGLYETHKDRQLLVQEGRLVWAHIVQANTMLFEAGNVDCPACVVIGDDESVDGRILSLKTAGSDIFAMKGKVAEHDDPSLKPFAEMVTDEKARPMGMAIPPSLSEKKIIFSTLLIRRKLLPDKMLSMSWFPVFVLPEKSVGCEMLHKSYWSKELRRLWLT